MRLKHLLPTLLLTLTLSAQTAAPASALNQNMRGDWTGQLEYRDYQTNGRVFLPTWLSMTATPTGNAVTLAYIFDDRP